MGKAKPQVRTARLGSFIELILFSLISSKSYPEAERQRKIGNSKYSSGDLAGALQCYNKGLSVLPHNIKDTTKNIQPLLLANRALVLHRQGYSKLALKDIQLAIQSGYPDKLLYKLHVRQAQCFSALGQAKVAEHCWSKAGEAVEKLESETERKDGLSFIAKQKKCVEMIEQKDCKVSNVKEHKIKDPHPKYPAFTNKIE